MAGPAGGRARRRARRPATGLAATARSRRGWRGRSPTVGWATGGPRRPAHRRRHRRPDARTGATTSTGLRRLGGGRDRAGGTAAPRRSGSTRTLLAALRQAEADPAGALRRRGAGPAARGRRPNWTPWPRWPTRCGTTSVGDDVTYVVNRNINFTNVCYAGCRFCAFAQRRTDADAYTLSLDEVGDRAAEAWEVGATEVCMQGGIHPDLPGTAYFDIAREVKRRCPDMHVHAFCPMEVVNGASRTGLPIREWLSGRRRRGSDTIPGTAAEILDDDVRWVLTKGKLPAARWIEVITTAHALGIRSSSTMMYGHVDTPAHWLAHLRLLARIQERTGGFTEFVALPFIHTQRADLPGRRGPARPDPAENRAVHAMARLLLHGAIDNIQSSWVKLGDDVPRRCCAGGVNDLGGTLMEETISRMAGVEHGSARRSGSSGDDRAAGPTVRQRTPRTARCPPSAWPLPRPATASARRSAPRCRCWDDRAPAAAGSG